MDKNRKRRDFRYENGKTIYPFPLSYLEIDIKRISEINANDFQCKHGKEFPADKCKVPCGFCDNI